MANRQTPPKNPIRVGCAGWSIPALHARRFPTDGSHLERYAARLPAVEINSSFYRPHRPATYVRWAESVPDDFAFAVKVPKAITHQRRLRGVGELLDRFLSEVTALGPKLGPLLVQLPPSLAYKLEVAESFLTSLRERFAGDAALEPRHPSWFEPAAEELLARHRVARVAADPAVVPSAASPGGWTGLTYYRLHGSPQMYYSNYQPEFLGILRRALESDAQASHVWCIFDNTAEGAATDNALDVVGRIGST